MEVTLKSAGRGEDGGKHFPPNAFKIRLGRELGHLLQTGFCQERLEQMILEVTFNLASMILLGPTANAHPRWWDSYRLQIAGMYSWMRRVPGLAPTESQPITLGVAAPSSIRSLRIAGSSRADSPLAALPTLAHISEDDLPKCQRGFTRTSPQCSLAAASTGRFQPSRSVASPALWTALPEKNKPSPSALCCKCCAAATTPLPGCFCLP